MTALQENNQSSLVFQIYPTGNSDEDCSHAPRVGHNCLNSPCTPRRNPQEYRDFVNTSFISMGYKSCLIFDQIGQRLRERRIAAAWIGVAHSLFHRFSGWIRAGFSRQVQHLMFSRNASAGVLYPRHFLGVELTAHVISSISRAV